MQWQGGYHDGLDRHGGSILTYEHINHALRAGHMPTGHSDEGDEHATTVRELDRLTHAHRVPHDTVMYRLGNRVGVDRGFAGATLNRESDFFSRSADHGEHVPIHVPKGTRAAYLDAVDPMDHEVLFPRGTEFREHVVNGKREIHVHQTALVEAGALDYINRPGIGDRYDGGIVLKVIGGQALILDRVTGKTRRSPIQFLEAA